MKLRASGYTACVIALPIDAPSRAVFCIVHPSNDKATATESSYGGHILSVRGGGADVKLGTRGNTACVIALPIDTPVRAIFSFIHPCNYKAAIAKRCDRGVPLVVCGGGVDLKFSASGSTACVIALPEDSPAQAVFSLIHPGYDKAAIAKSYNCGVLLAIQGCSTGVKLSTGRPNSTGNRIVPIRKSQSFNARYEVCSIVAIRQIQVCYRPRTQHSFCNSVVSCSASEPCNVLASASLQRIVTRPTR